MCSIVERGREVSGNGWHTLALDQTVYVESVMSAFQFHPSFPTALCNDSKVTQNLAKVCQQHVRFQVVRRAREDVSDSSLRGSVLL
jgi:hypothetical protein